MLEEKFYHKHNILQIVPSLNCGGVERGTIDIAKAIIANSYQASVLSTGGPLVDKLTEMGATFIKHNVASKNPWCVWRNIGFIEQLIKTNNITLIHARSRAPAWSAYYAAQKAKVPFITTFHGIYNSNSQLKAYYNSIMTKGERVIAVSNFVKNHILENYTVDESKIRVIHRGIDLAYFNPEVVNSDQKEKFRNKYNIPKNIPIILLPSRMTRWKGQESLIEALNLIRDQDFYCLLVGDLTKHPDYVARLREKIVNLRLQSKVQIFGTELNMVGLYNLADIILSTSIEPEAFGRTIVEAQAMAKLVIATDIGGAAETIKDSYSGFHVQPNNPEMLAEKIKYALNILGSSTAETIINNARNSVIQHFSLEQMQSKTIAVYRELL